MKPQNKSERIFERYLNLNGFRKKWTHEPSIQAKNTRPDYQLNYNGRDYFFEVKELRKKKNEPTKWPAYIDPYTGLRNEIHKTKRQFKEYKEYCCSLVVFNINDRQTKLAPHWVTGTMLGNLGIKMSLDAEKGRVVNGTERNVFLGGGKMGREKNTTISSIVILKIILDNSEAEKVLVEEMEKQGRPFTLDEKVDTRMRIREDHHVRRVPGVVVVENPYARIAFPKGLFAGPFDERWHWTEETGKIERVFAGNKLKELEELRNKT